MPYLRNKTSTLLVFSAIALLLLVSSPTLFFDFLLQPVQASTEMTYKTLTPASGTSLTGEEVF
jgi:hypothetical protein